jgi:hypothetical protein
VEVVALKVADLTIMTEAREGGIEVLSGIEDEVLQTEKLLATRDGKKTDPLEENAELLRATRHSRGSFLEILLGRRQELTSKNIMIFQLKHRLRMVRFRGQSSTLLSSISFCRKLFGII